MKQLALNRLAATEIRRVRQLPFPGQVLVEEGQPVHPEDRIAIGELPGEIFKLDIARGLGIDPSEVLACLVRDLGEVLDQDDVIAECKGALPRLMRVPQSGELLTCRDGVAFMASGKRLFEIRAGMIGVVSTILPERGAILSAKGSLIQGVWGNGRVGAGILRTQITNSSQALTLEELNQFDEGQVIAAGMCVEEGDLNRIVGKQPTGLILGSLRPELINRVAALDFPVILLGGLGELPPDQIAFQLLREKRGQVVCLNAGEPDHLEGEWPEVIIPSSTEKTQASLPFRTDLKVGLRAQALSGPEKGGVFTVVGLPEEKITLESGLTCQVATLKSDEGEEFTVPRENLLILGN